MKKQTIFLLFFVLVVGIVLGFIGQKFLFAHENKNRIASRAIYSSSEWQNQKTHFPGSEFSFAFSGSKSVSFHMQAEDKDSVELVVTVDNKVFILDEPNLNDERLSVEIPQSDISKQHTVTGKVYCLPGINPCALQMDEISLEGGEIIPWQTPEKTLGILGDSVSLFQLSNGYPSLLATSLGLHVHNASLWGRTAGVDEGRYPAISLYKKDLLSYRPDTIIMFLGINDVYYGASEDAFKHDYASIVTGIKKELPDAKIVLVGILPGKQSDDESDRITPFNSDIQSIAQDQKITFVDSSSWLTTDDYSDQFHPTVSGEQKIASHLAGIISH